MGDYRQSRRRVQLFNSQHEFDHTRQSVKFLPV
jgi:hypothetical protein